jgi:hypothetical protein
MSLTEGLITLSSQYVYYCYMYIIVKYVKYVYQRICILQNMYIS